MRPVQHTLEQPAPGTASSKQRAQQSSRPRTLSATLTLWSPPRSARSTACIMRGIGGIRCSSRAGASRHSSAASSSCGGWEGGKEGGCGERSETLATQRDTRAATPAAAPAAGPSSAHLDGRGGGPVQQLEAGVDQLGVQARGAERGLHLEKLAKRHAVEERAQKAHAGLRVRGWGVGEGRAGDEETQARSSEKRRLCMERHTDSQQSSPHSSDSSAHLAAGGAPGQPRVQALGHIHDVRQQHALGGQDAQLAQLLRLLRSVWFVDGGQGRGRRRMGVSWEALSGSGAQHARCAHHSQHSTAQRAQAAPARPAAGCAAAWRSTSRAPPRSAGPPCPRGPAVVRGQGEGGRVCKGSAWEASSRVEAGGGMCLPPGTRRAEQDGSAVVQQAPTRDSRAPPPASSP